MIGGVSKTPPGVGEHLALVAEKAIVPKVDRSMVSFAIKTLVQRLEAEFDRFTLTRAEVAGAWTRETSLPQAMDPNDDIDVLVVFRERGHLVEHYLNLLRHFAELHYPRSAIESEGTVLRIKLLPARVRLVPAHESITGLQIPGYGNSWIRIDPAAAAQELAAKDKQHEGLLLPVVRLAKYWNVRNGMPFGSWDLEQKALAHRFAFVPKNIKAYWFDFMRSLIVDAATAPAKAETVRQMRRDLDELDRLVQAGKVEEAKARIEAMLPIPAKLLAGPPFGGSVAYKPMKL